MTTQHPMTLSFKTSSDGTTAVALNVYWQEMNTAPRGVDIWLLTKYGKPIDGQWNNQPDVIGWFPKPRIPKFMKELIK